MGPLSPEANTTFVGYNSCHCSAILLNKFRLVGRLHLLINLGIELKV